MTLSRIFLFISLLLSINCLASPLDDNPNIDFQQIGDEGRRIEIFRALIDLDDIDSQKNKDIVRTFRENLGLTEDIPIIVEGLTKSQSIRLGLERLSHNNVEEFINEYKFKNPVINEKITEEAISFIESGSAPEDLKQEFKKEITTPNWGESKSAKISKSVFQPSKFIRTVSKKTFQLTVIRTAFSFAANFTSAFIKSSSLAKSLFQGLVSSSMTGAVQVNPTLFEKMLSGNFARLKYFGLEAVFIIVPAILSSFLEIRSFHLQEILFEVFIYGTITVFTQGNAELWAAQQLQRTRKFVESQLILIENATHLSRETKDAYTAVLMGLLAPEIRAFSTSMMGGSLIWTQGVALIAAGFAAAAPIAVFSALTVYSQVVKYVTAKGMLSLEKEAYKKGFQRLLKDIKNIHIGAPKVLRDFAIAFGKDTINLSKIIVRPIQRGCNRLFTSK